MRIYIHLYLCLYTCINKYYILHIHSSIYPKYFSRDIDYQAPGQGAKKLPTRRVFFVSKIYNWTLAYLQIKISGDQWRSVEIECSRSDYKLQVQIWIQVTGKRLITFSGFLDACISFMISLILSR